MAEDKANVEKAHAENRRILELLKNVNNQLQESLGIFGRLKYKAKSAASDIWYPGKDEWTAENYQAKIKEGV